MLICCRTGGARKIPILQTHTTRNKITLFTVQSDSVAVLLCWLSLLFLFLLLFPLLSLLLLLLLLALRIPILKHSRLRERFRRDFRLKQIPAPQIFQGRSDIREAYKIRCASAGDPPQASCSGGSTIALAMSRCNPKALQKEGFLLLGHESRNSQRLTCPR